MKPRIGRGPPAAIGGGFMKCLRDQNATFHVSDIDYHFEAVGDADASWMRAEALSRAAEAMMTLESGSNGLWLAAGGFLHLRTVARE
jgi:hypothetical protein